MSIRGYAEECSTSRVGYVEGWYVARGCTEFASDALIHNYVSHAAHRALGFEEVVRIVCFKRIRSRVVG